MSKGWLPAEHGRDNRGLRDRVARGLIWTLADSWGRQLLGLAIFIVIARLVTQADIGLVALAAVFIRFAEIFIDQGLSDALVQRRVLAREHIDSAFWMSVGIGALLTAGGLLLAVPIAALLNEPQLQPILQVLALSFVLTALTSVQQAILRRELAFRSLALRSLVASAGGGVVGIALAFLGFGAWALVAQALAQAAVAVLVLWTVSPWRPGLRFSPPHFMELFGFSRNVIGSDIVSFFSRNTDYFLVGAFLGTVQLGIYAVGFRILEATGALLVGISRRIAFPAFSRLQHDPERLKRAFFRVTRLSGLIILPGYVGLALVAPELVIVFFGERWTESGPVAAILFLVGPVTAINNFNSAVLNASGHPNIVFRFRLLTTLTNVAGFTIAVVIFANILAVAAAYAIRAYALMPLALYWQRRYAGIPIREYLAQMGGIGSATLAMVPVVLAIKLILGPQLGPASLLAAEVVAGAIVFVIVLLLVDRRLLVEMFEVVGQALPSARRGRRRPASTTRDLVDEAESVEQVPTDAGDERETI